MISDGTGGAMLGVDLYPGAGPARHLCPEGRFQRGLSWGSQGVPVSVAESYQYSTKLIHDGSGGLIFAWEDYRPDESYSDIYCQRIGRRGSGAIPSPGSSPARMCRRIREAGADHDEGVAEGRREELYPIFGYNVWRLIGGGGPLAASAGAASTDVTKLLALLSDPATAVGVRVNGRRRRRLVSPKGTGSRSASGSRYAIRSTHRRPDEGRLDRVGNPRGAYIVTAHTSMAGVFVTSAPAVGCSVDNLVPGMTPGFAGRETASPEGLI